MTGIVRILTGSRKILLLGTVDLDCFFIQSKSFKMTTAMQVSSDQDFLTSLKRDVNQLMVKKPLIGIVRYY